MLCYDGSDEDDIAKLQVLLDSDDGFRIAEEDLKRRGPGEVGGYRQSGMPDFERCNIIDDFKIFECARGDAQYMIEHPRDPSFRQLIDEAKKKILSISLA